jgi:hypothetical protein
MFLMTACFHSLRSQRRGFHDLLREKRSSIIRVVGMELNLYRLYVDSVHASQFPGQNAGVV